MIKGSFMVSEFLYSNSKVKIYDHLLVKVTVQWNYELCIYMNRSNTEAFYGSSDRLWYKFWNDSTAVWLLSEDT
jgi:hypothetical protein